MIIDSHIHLSHRRYAGEFPYLCYEDGAFAIQKAKREQLIQRFKQEGIQACIEPAIEIWSNEELLALADQYPDFLFPAVGVHPTRTYRYSNKGLNQKKKKKKGTKAQKNKSASAKLLWKQRKQLALYADHPQVIAIGETGLDYHQERAKQHRLRQKRWFLFQLHLAHKKNLPVILHIRKADADAIRILSLFKNWIHGGVCHCFTGTLEQARIYIKMGLKLGIGGELLKDTTIRDSLEQVIVETSLRDILLETDGPHEKPDRLNLPEKDVENARNTSLILPAVAERIAELKQISIEEVLAITSENTIKLFRLNIK